MGQYFRVVNLDKKEYLNPTGSKLWELCANNDVRMLGYLLSTNNTDGTSLIKYFKDPARAKERYGENFEILSYDSGIGHGEVKTEYFGRWCNDRVAIVGDYASGSTNYTVGKDGPSYHEIYENPEWNDITEAVTEEFNQFVGASHLKAGDLRSMRPDAIISEKGIQYDPKIIK